VRITHFFVQNLGNLCEITRDRPVGNIVTNTKYQSWVSHVQIQCTITLD